MCTLSVVVRRRKKASVATSPEPFMYSQIPRSRWDRDAANITHVRRSTSSKAARRTLILIGTRLVLSWRPASVASLPDHERRVWLGGVHPIADVDGRSVPAR